MVGSSFCMGPLGTICSYHEKSQRYNMSQNKEEVGRSKKQEKALHSQACSGGEISSVHVPRVVHYGLDGTCL